MRLDLEKERQRISQVIPDEIWKAQHEEAMQVRDLEELLDALCQFFRTIRRADEENHLLACQPEYKDFEKVDAAVISALKDFIRWGKGGIESSGKMIAKGFEVDFMEEAAGYLAAAQDMLEEEPSFILDSRFADAIDEAEREVEAGELEDFD